MPSFKSLSWTCGNLNMIEMSRARLNLASAEIWKTFSRQLKAISMISLLRSKCWDFSLVKITMNDFMIASLSSACFLSIFSGSTWDKVISPSLVAINEGDLSLKMRLLAFALNTEAYDSIFRAAGVRVSKPLISFGSLPKVDVFIIFATWLSASNSIYLRVLLD